MNKVFICLALALFVCAQAAIKVENIQISTNPKTVTDDVLDFSVKTFLQQEQEAKIIPYGPLAFKRVERKDEKTVVRTSSGSYKWFFDLKIQAAAAKAEFHAELVAYTDSQNSTIVLLEGDVKRVRKFGVWPGVAVTEYVSGYGKFDYNVSDYINKPELAEKVFVEARISDIYFKVVSHTLLAVYFSGHQINYNFAVTLENRVTGELIHQERYLSWYWPTSSGKFTVQDESRIDMKPVYNSVSFRNTTELYYNPAIVLSNELLKTQVLKEAVNSIIQEALKPEVFGKNLTGRFDLTYRPLFVSVTEAGFNFKIETTIWADRREYYRDLRAELFVSPTGESLKSKATVSEWVPMFVRGPVYHAPPVWPDRD